MTMVVTRERFDPQVLRSAYGAFPTGVVAVCAEVEGRLVGLAISAFTPVSLDPPLLGVCIQSSSATWPHLQRADVVGVSVLSRHQRGLATQLAGPSADRFDGVDHGVCASGAVIIDGAQLAFECTIDEILAAGDHELVLLRVERIWDNASSTDPMVFHRSRFTGLRLPRNASGGAEASEPWLW
jgi:flavin reductase (DIM6/NTAB) family NADH-FMN oxidoreductase RutF